jgi:long-chain acyl-CoA synthetase
MLLAWAKNHRLADLSLEEARASDVVRAELWRAVDNANKAVSQPESIRKFTVLADDFTEENGYLTPSLKLKRNLVMRDYTTEVEALYSKPRE